VSIVWQALWFIVAVSLLVTVHEFGHYWVARRFGFKILRFSIGFGRPLFKRIAGPDRTEYVIAALPLGGYVKMLDEREGPVEPHELSRSFTRKPPWQRIVVLLAGPAFNIAFAILVLWGMFWIGGITEVKPIIGDVQQGSVAAHGGLQPGDEVLSINGDTVAGMPDVLFGVLDAMSSDGEATLQVRGRDGTSRTATLSVPDPAERRKLTEPTGLFTGLGFRFWSPPVPPVVGELVADGPAQRAGLKPGDRLLAIGDKAVDDFRDIASATAAARPGDTLIVRYQRGGNDSVARVTVGAREVDGRELGYIGVGQVSGIRYPDNMMLHTDLGPVGALQHAAIKAWQMTALQARLVGRMLLGNVSFKNLSGPLSIAEFAGESATGGVASFLGFLVLISLSLGFLNLLPIPILDGGQIVFQLAEWLKGTPLSERTQMLGQQVGLALLVLLMGVALFNDIVRQFH
jgi:regulator of sigma E protease